MAIHNEIRRGTLSAALTRAVAAMRGGGGLERFGETLTPTIDLWGLPEWAYLRQETLGVVMRVAIAGANNSAVALANPLTSRSLVVVEEVTVLPTAQLTIDLYSATDSTAALPSSQLAWRRDQRQANDDGTSAFLTTRTIARYSDGTIAVIPPDWNVVLERIVCPVTGGRSVTCVPHVLAPGRMLVVYHPTAANALTVNFKFRERANIDDER